MSYDISRAVHPRILALLTFLSLGFPDAALAVSFDCTKASSRVEKLICTDSDLSRLDDALAAGYRAIQRIGFFDSQVKPQRAWVMKRNACHDKACVQALYESRIAELHELVNNLPGPSSKRSESPEYVVKCDPRKGILSILESDAPDLDPSEEEPLHASGAVKHVIRPNTLTKGEERDGQFFLLADKEENFQCRLGTAMYRVTIAPYIFNANVMGECGATEPVISAQVTRDGQVILADQRFATCRGAEGRVIHRIRIDERRQSMRILVTLDEFVLPLSIEKSFSFSALPAQLEHAVFDSFPTGDVDVDLFLAVRKRDPDQVRRALALGAAPNTTDMNGFTPLAYLWKGRWGRSVAGHTLEQEEHNAEDIAEVLFANGASGNVKNNDGVSLLEYLIGNAPPRVIDLLLQHGADPKSDQSLAQAATQGDMRLVEKLLALGADPKSDRSLANAASQGDVRLIEKLLALGADPNAKTRDGRTALWAASVSGFYPSFSSDKPRRSMDDYVRCVRLLLRNGAKVDVAINDSEGMLWFLVRSFSKDERLKLIMAELIPYSSKAAIKKAYDLSIKLESSQEGKDLSTWLGQFVRP